MPVSLATDGNAPLAGAAAWSESSDQHPCPPLQEAQLLGAAPSGHGRERPRRLDALRRRPLLHRLRKGGSPNRRLSPSRRVSEVCARARDATDTALERGGARGRRAGTDMHMHMHMHMHMQHAHAMCMCARHVNGDVAPRACSACCTAYRCAYVHVALHIHQASAPRRACATRAGSPRTSMQSPRQGVMRSAHSTCVPL